MRKYLKRHIGQILVDAGFLSRQVLASALHEQKRTREKLGQVLVRMGVVKAPDMKASLLAQKYLSNIEDAVKMAAGDRQMLGSLLVESGRMSDADLDLAIAEQQRTGAKLGEVLVRLGFVSQPQLDALLNFQANQAAHASSPFRLGELLVTTGDLSRKHLKAALAKQSVSRKKLGEVLVEEGYLRPSQVEYGIGLQKMLMHAVLAAILSIGVVSTSNASDFELTWDPSPDASVVGYKVYYQADSEVQPFQGSGSVDGAAPINVGSGVTTTVRGLTPGHTYYFAVTAYDDSGTESVYSNVIALAAPLPSTAITFPTSNQTVSGALTIQADSLNNPSVSALQFFVNGTLQGFDTAAPYEQTWDTSGLAPGSYTLTAKAVDSSGNVTESSGVSVQVAATDSTAPSVSLTAPQNSTVVSGATTISATATDDVGVSRVEFFLNGELLYAGNSAPFTFSWDTSSVANGVHTLVAKAYDAAGHAAQTSDISVLVNNVVPDTDAPAVTSFTMPATANNLSVAISSYAASDNIAVAGYLVTESAAAPSTGAAGWSDTAPSSFTFSAAGARTAYAWAKDAAGNVSAPASSNVTITLPDTAAPAISSFVMPASADSLTVSISSFAASDNVGVTGYLVTESATAPSASATSWSATPPSSFTFSAAGTRTAYAWTKDAAGNVSAAATRSVTITLPDTAVPAISSFVMPSSSDSLTVGISSFAASDNVAVAGFLVTESATAPAAGASGWSTSSPSSFTFSGSGAKTAYAWTKDAAGNVSLPLSRSVTITLSDTEVPNVTSFTMPANAASLTVGISTFAASDNVGVIGYLVTESAAAPSASAAGWRTAPPSSFTFSGSGAKTAYAWTKDAAGNVSLPLSRSVTITLSDTVVPDVTSFSMPASAASLTVGISTFAASDNVGVIGYLVTESAAAPSASAAGWSATAPSSFTFSAAGARTAYAWTKDAAGNVSAPASSNVTINIPDTAAPAVSSFVMPTSASSLTVAISSFAVSDNVGVTGYLVTESATAPAADASGWSAIAPTSFTFSAAGTRTAYAWTKDAAGNVSAASTRSVAITLPDTTIPTVSSFVIPASSDSLTVGISSFAGSDNVAVAGYLVTESATAPAAGASGWSTAPPSSFTFSGSGTKTAYAWTKDAAGNVSASATRSVTITLPTESLTVSDALLALNIAAGKITPTAEHIARLDVGPYIGGKSAPDGVVNTGDVVVLLSKITGKDPAKR